MEACSGHLRRVIEAHGETVFGVAHPGERRLKVGERPFNIDAGEEEGFLHLGQRSAHQM